MELYEEGMSVVWPVGMDYISAKQLLHGEIEDMDESKEEEIGPLATVEEPVLQDSRNNS